MSKSSDKTNKTDNIPEFFLKRKKMLKKESNISGKIEPINKIIIVKNSSVRALILWPMKNWKMLLMYSK